MDVRDLRRRSPNPNSTGEFSTTLSPHARSEYSTSSLAPPSHLSIPAEASRSGLKRIPTIKLVQTTRHSNQPYGPLPIPPVIRSKSDDGGGHATPPGLLGLLSTTLRRNESTPNPSSYPSQLTWQQSQDLLEGPTLGRHRPTTTHSIRGNRSPSPTLRFIADDTSLKAAQSMRSAASTFFSIRNPFRRRPSAQDGPEAVDKGEAEEAISLRAPSMKSKWSADSSSSLLTTRSDSRAAEKTFQVRSSDSTRYTGDKDQPVQKVRARPSCTTHLGKFPFVGSRVNDGEWTVFKWILLASVISVSISCPLIPRLTKDDVCPVAVCIRSRLSNLGATHRASQYASLHSSSIVADSRASPNARGRQRGIRSRRGRL